MPRGRVLGWYVLMGAVGYLGEAYCYFGALRFLPGGLVSLLWDVVRRLRIFLQQVTLRDAQGAPSVAGLWDQVQAAGALIAP